MSTWKPKLKSTCINFQKLANQLQFSYETFVKDKYLDDFGNVEIISFRLDQKGVRRQVR
jgi:hypothetical protein